MRVHPIYYDYDRLPVAPVMKLLDSNVFFWLVVVVTVVAFLWLAAKAWELHSIPKKVGAGAAQASLIFWLALLGLIWKPLWIAAVVMILVDWQAFARWIRENILYPDTADTGDTADAIHQTETARETQS